MGTIDNEVQKMVTKFRRQQGPLQLPYVWCALIGKFEKAGDIVGAIEVLKGLGRLRLITWTYKHIGRVFHRGA